MPTPNYNRNIDTQTYWSRVSTSPAHPSSVFPVNNAALGIWPTSSNALSASGTTTAKYAILAKLKRLPNNPYSKYVENMSDPIQSVKRNISDWPSPPYEYNGPRTWTDTFQYNAYVMFYGAVQTFSAFPATSAYQKALNKVMKKTTLTKSQSAVSLLELGKTASMIAKTATRLAASIRSLRRGELGSFAASLGIVIPKKQTTIWLRDHRKYKRGSTELSEFRFTSRPTSAVKRFRAVRTIHVNNSEDFLAKSWLEFSYGWRPLLKDVYDTSEAVASLMVDNDFKMQIASGNGEETFLNGSRSYNPDGTFWLERQESYQESVNVVVHFRLEAPPPVYVALGLNNPALVAWELLPFSFVVDWFLPVGTFLESFTAFDGLSFHSGYTSKKIKRNLLLQATPGKPLITAGDYGPTTMTYEHFICRLVREGFTFQRTVLTHWPLYGMPKLKSPVSISHAISGIALLHSLFIGRAR